MYDNINYSYLLIFRQDNNNINKYFMTGERSLLQDVLGITGEVENKKVNETVQEEKEPEQEVTGEKDTNTSEEQKLPSEDKKDDKTEEEVVENKEEETQAEEQQEVKTDESEEKPEDKKEDEQVKSDESLINLAKEIQPDGEYSDNASALEVIKSDLKEKSEFIEKAKKWNDELVNLFEQNPDVAEFTKAVINGTDPKVAAAIYISETLAPEEGEQGSEEYKKQMAKRKEQAEKQEQEKKEFVANIEKSEATIKEFAKENNINEKELKPFLEDLSSELISFNKGIATKSFLSTVLKGKMYDKKIKEAEDAAYLRGKNEKIKLVAAKKNEGDGLPSIKSGRMPDTDMPKPKKGMIERTLDAVFENRR